MGEPSPPGWVQSFGRASCSGARCFGSTFLQVLSAPNPFPSELQDWARRGSSLNMVGPAAVSCQEEFYLWFLVVCVLGAHCLGLVWLWQRKVGEGPSFSRPLPCLAASLQIDGLQCHSCCSCVGSVSLLAQSPSPACVLALWMNLFALLKYLCFLPWGLCFCKLCSQNNQIWSHGRWKLLAGAVTTLKANLFSLSLASSCYPLSTWQPLQCASCLTCLWTDVWQGIRLRPRSSVLTLTNSPMFET